MSNVIELNPEARRARNMLFDATSRVDAPISGLDTGEVDDEIDALDTFQAMFLRENVVNEMFREDGFITRNVRDAFTDGPDLERDESWNPYAYIQQEWPEEQRAEHDLLIRQGFFDDAHTPDQVETQLRNHIRESASTRAMNEGPGFAAFTGGMAGVLADPTTYIPLAPLARAKTGRTLKGILLGTAGAAIQEIPLQLSQEQRSALESFMNIGFGGIIGGGVGLAAEGLHRASRLNPDHPEYPFTDKGVASETHVVRDAYGDINEFGYGTAGAAESGDRMGGVSAPGIFSDIPGVGAVLKKLSRATIVGRAVTQSSARARYIGMRLLDMGGRMFRNADGSPMVQRASAEDIKQQIVNMYDQITIRGEGLLSTLNRELGQSSSGQRFGLKGTVDSDDFNEITRLQLHEDLDSEAAEVFIKKYGDEAFEKIRARASEYAELIHENNALVTAELKTLGVLKDDAVIARLDGEIAAIRDQIERETAAWKETRNVTDDTPMPEETLKDLRQQRDALVAERSAESQKPVDMGREYGHAQLWDRENIVKQREELEDFLFEVLGESPNSEWLMTNHGLTEAEFDKLGTTPASEGAPTRQDIIRDWAGDEHAFQLGRAERQLAAAEYAEKQAVLDLNDVLRAHHWLKQDEANLTVSQARSKRDAIGARVAEARAQRDAIASAKRTMMAELRAAKSKADLEEIARLEGAAKANDAELSRASKRLKEMFDRQQAIEARFADVDGRLEATKNARKAVADSVDDARRAGKVTAKELKAARRELRKLRAGTSLEEDVTRIVRTLSDKGDVPFAVLDNLAVEPGRVKARRIHLDKSQRRFAESKGWLRTDLNNILHSQYEQTGGFIGIHSGLDIRKGGTYESWQDVLDDIDASYEQMIRESTDAKKTARLQGERDQSIADINNLKSRLMGTEDLGMDRDGWVYWLSSKMRQLNLVRYIGGFIISSMTDLATAALTSRGLGKFLGSSFEPAIRILQTMHDENPSEFLSWMQGAELGANGMRIAKLADADDAMHLSGIGPRGSTKHKVTGSVDEAGKWLVEKGNMAGGMRIWNRMLKIMSGYQRATYLRDNLAKYDSLSDVEKNTLAALGVGKQEAAHVQKFLAKHGVNDERGFFDPNLAAWREEAGGMDAVRTFRTAVDRDMRRGVITPGIGDTPRLMSKGGGKLWLQFQSFNFAFTNRYLIPASQRMRQGDVTAMASFGHLAWLGGMVVIMKAITRGEDPAELIESSEWSELLIEQMDRMGLFAYTSPFVDAALKGTSSTQEALFGTSLKPTSRFSRNNAVMSLLGVNANYPAEMGRLVGALDDRDADKVLDQALRLAPMQTQLRLFNNFALGNNPNN